MHDYDDVCVLASETLERTNCMLCYTRMRVFNAIVSDYLIRALIEMFNIDNTYTIYYSMVSHSDLD